MHGFKAGAAAVEVAVGADFLRGKVNCQLSRTIANERPNCPEDKSSEAERYDDMHATP